MERCGPCESGRRDGLPCDVEKCSCRCHREGKTAVEKMLDPSLDEARAIRNPLRMIGKAGFWDKIIVERKEADGDKKETDL